MPNGNACASQHLSTECSCDWYDATVPPSSARHAKAITVLNLKGGVGKTHAAWTLAAVCQERKRRLLLVDLDTQANLTGSFLPEAEKLAGSDTLFNPTAENEIAELVRPSAYSHIDVIPASSRLARFDLTDSRQWERADLHLSLVDPVESLRSQYDYILFDCPPRLSVVSFAALCASDFVIIPLEAADWGAQGIVQVSAVIDDVQRRYNRRLQLLGYLVSRFKRARAYQQSYLRELHEHFGDLALDTVIPDLARFEQSVTDRVPITLHAPGSEEARIARAFFREVERRIERLSRSGPKRRQADIRHAATVAA